MALTYTPAAQLGTTCPPFSLLSVEQKKIQLSDFKNSKVLAVLFICGHCPYVQAIEDRLVTLGKKYAMVDVAFVGICSNDPIDYPEDQPAALLARWRDRGYTFPYLIDSEQTVAKAFGAVCTPDFFVYDRDRRLKYRGRLDDSWKNPNFVKKQELQAAIDQLLDGQDPSGEQIPSMGCSIKWKAETNQL